MKNIRIVTPAELLGGLDDAERKNAPDRLCVAGDVGLFRTGLGVSVIGSRRATAEGLALAARVSWTRVS